MDAHMTREHLQLHTTLMLKDLYPIHIAGASMFLVNQSDEDRVLTLADSPDGSTWTTQLVALGGANPVASVTIMAQGNAMIAFSTMEKYLRLSLDARCEEGVSVDLVQFPHGDRDSVDNPWY